jgi:hypothetical protein
MRLKRRDAGTDDRTGEAIIELVDADDDYRVVETIREPVPRPVSPPPGQLALQRVAALLDTLVEKEILTRAEASPVREP